ncbi:pseudouridine synthase [Tannerella forsythia]|nr:pseudouridine synthase [Tannerella forsythia]
MLPVTKESRRMNRYFIWLAYKGTNYCGWQRQPNGLSVQQCVEDVLETVLRRPVPLTGAGRTDAGVHARRMAAHFDVPKALDDTERLAGKLNRMLPQDIAIARIVPVRADAHARFDALSRRYQYLVSEKKDPFDYETVCCMSLRGMDFGAMNEVAKTLYDYTDFTSFSKLHTDVKTNNCRIDEARWEKDGTRWVFTIQADRFLRNMVRAMVGTMFEVGRGKRSVDDFRRLIEAKDRCRAGTSAPPEGLTLIDIDYPDDLFTVD